jgi:cyclic pyranopterin monophosphate synthase
VSIRASLGRRFPRNLGNWSYDRGSIRAPAPARRYARVSVSELSHLDEAGRARMVDVGGKEVTDRRAVARAVVRMLAETAAAVRSGDAPKGDVLGTARIAGIQAAKRTAELIPLCHPLPLSFVDVRMEVGHESVEIESEARTSAQTGVEMEALTAASVAALTVYDMVKGLERGVEITELALVEKSGGRHDWRRRRAREAGPGLDRSD